MPKWLMLSKSFWVGLLTTLLGLLALFMGEEWIKANPALVGWLTTASGILTMILRVLTGTPVTLTDPKK